MGQTRAQTACALIVGPDQQRAAAYRHLVAAEGLPVKLARG